MYASHKSRTTPLIWERPWGMKMDIEGYETLTLRGSWRLFSPEMAPCRVWFEYQREVAVASGAGEFKFFQILDDAGLY